MSSQTPSQKILSSPRGGASQGACAKETGESSTASHRVRQTSDTSASASGIIKCRKHGPLLFSSVPCNMIGSCAAPGGFSTHWFLHLAATVEALCARAHFLCVLTGSLMDPPNRQKLWDDFNRSCILLPRLLPKSSLYGRISQTQSEAVSGPCYPTPLRIPKFWVKLEWDLELRKQLYIVYR